MQKWLRSHSDDDDDDDDVDVFFSSTAYPFVGFLFQHSTCLRLDLALAATLVIIAPAAAVVGGHFS